MGRKSTAKAARDELKIGNELREGRNCCADSKVRAVDSQHVDGRRDRSKSVPVYSSRFASVEEGKASTNEDGVGRL